MRKLFVGLSALVAAALCMPTATAAPAPQAVYSRSAMSKAQQGDFPGALGKVTKAGKVGTIDASVGDIVLSACDEVPDNFSGQAPNCSAPSSALTTQAAAATVLHASETLIDPAGPAPDGGTARVRGQTALEEDTSGNVRLYWRQRLVYGPNDTTWTTYHDATNLYIHRGDYGTNQADNCGVFYTAHCSAVRSGGNQCRGGFGGPCDVYLEVGSYRPKGDSADKWVMAVEDPIVFNPQNNSWYNAQKTCGSPFMNTGLLWTVSGSPAPYRPTQCPVSFGRPFA